MIRAILLWCLLWPGLAMAEAQLVGQFNWRAPIEGFGGFSALELSPDGTEFTALTDRALLVQGKVLRNRQGQITAMQPQSHGWLTDPKSQRLGGAMQDSEGLAQRRDGRLYVSFEGTTPRIWTYRGIGSEAAWLPRPPAFRRLQRNSGLEGLAIDASGALYTLPERSGRLDRPFPVWRYRRGTWDQPFSIPRRGDLLPVGLDFGPDGRLYLLERHFQGFSFKTRLRRFTLTASGLTNEETLLEPAMGTHTNLEGLALWRDPQGRIRATMISDNNFLALLSTSVVEYILPD